MTANRRFEYCGSNRTEPDCSAARPAALLASLGVIALGIGVYFGVWNHEFLSRDDPLNVTENRYLQPPTLTNLRRFWQAPYEGIYAPVAYMFWAIEAWLSLRLGPSTGSGGFDPRIFHTGNLILHIGNSLVVLAILRHLTGSVATAWFGAVLFLVHPLQVEAICWVTETRGLLAAWFGMVGLWSYMKSVDPSPTMGRRSRIAWRTLTVLTWLLALLSKPSAAAFPLIAAVIDYTWFRRGVWRISRAVVPWIPVVVTLALLTQSQQGAETIGYVPSVWLRPIVALDTIGFFLVKIVWPVGLGTDYGRTPQWVLGGFGALPMILITLSTAIVAYLLPARRNALGVFGVLVAGLAPTLGLVPFSHQAFSTTADRFAYLAMLAPALGAALVARRVPNRIALPAASLVLTVLGALAHRQTVHWRDDEAMYKRALAVNPRSHMAHNNLGVWLLESGRFDDAAHHFKSALAIKPDYADAHNNLGNAHYKRHDYARAIESYARALAIDPLGLSPRFNLGKALAAAGRTGEAIQQFESLLSVNRGYSNVHFELACALESSGEVTEALEHYFAAIQIDPRYVEARRRFGKLLLAVGQPGVAAEHLSAALRLDGESIDARLDYAAALLARRQLAAATRQYRKILKRSVNEPTALNNLAWILATTSEAELRRPDEAVALAERRRRQSKAPPNSTTLDTLAAAYAAAGRFADAERTVREAIAMAEGDDRRIARMNERLEAYQNHRAWNEP